MAEQNIYFQWQNEALLRTIYPLRILNLRNALEYYKEIDLWKEYEGKKIDDIPGDVANYHQKKAAVIQQAKQDYERQQDYFFDYDPEQDQELHETDPAILTILKKSKKQHADFQAYYSYRVDVNDKRKKITDPFRKSYFISQQLETLDKDRKELDQQIIRQSRRIAAIKSNSLPDPQKLTEANTILAKLQNAVPLFERQREQLVKLISAFGKIESRRKDFLDRKKQAEKTKKKINAELPTLQPKIDVQQSKLVGFQNDLQRLRLQPEADTEENYFADPDALTEMAHRFPQADAAFCERMDAIREALAVLDDQKALQERLQEELSALRVEYTHYRQRSRSEFKEQTLKAYDEVLKKIEEYHSVQSKENEISGIQKTLKELIQKMSDFLNQIKAMKFLDMAEDEYVLNYQPVPPTMKDIVALKVDEYREELLAGDKTKDPFQYQFFLLEKLIERFKLEPERFPRWLQYMIVHFSGMRYASAHGSWADPNDLYRTLQISLIKNKALDDDAIADICFQKSTAYTGNAGLKGGREGGASRGSRKKDDKFQEKIDGYLARIGMDDPQERQQGLLNLLLDEVNYGLETMSDHEALDALEDLHDKSLIPNWMWKEVSALTDLRLKEATDKDWDKLTEEDRREKNHARGSEKYREIVNTWKEKYLTGWRQEHQVNIQNVVSRAVCNEVAEYILHLRGLEGAAGLTSLADMYTKDGIKPKEALKQAEVEKDAPYFVRSKKAEDFRPGAGILWLKYRNDPPPQWNVVKPFKTGAGDEMLPGGYLKGGRWKYRDKGLSRSATESVPFKGSQYLFWVHVATVAEVAQLGDESVVLTFETSLPSEDRRMACVGVFKRAVHNLTSDGTEDMYNASFVGYVPDKPNGIPEKDLDVMLDWNRVLLK